MAASLYSYQTNFLLSSMKQMLKLEGVKRGLWSDWDNPLTVNKRPFVTFSPNIDSFFINGLKGSNNCGIVFSLIDDRENPSRNEDLMTATEFGICDAIFEFYVYSTHQYTILASDPSLVAQNVIGITDLYKFLGWVFQSVNYQHIGMKDGYFDPSAYILEKQIKDSEGNPLEPKDFISFILEFYDARDWNRTKYSGLVNDMSVQIYKFSVYLSRVGYSDISGVYSPLNSLIEGFDPEEGSYGETVDGENPIWFH